MQVLNMANEYMSFGNKVTVSMRVFAYAMIH